MTEQKPGSTGTQASPADEAATAPPERVGMIAVAAYYFAEQRGFAPGQELEDWLQAEKALDAGTAGTTARS
ncbi:MAG: DUF2934 domain-containing protein [Pseudomonadota bacterium]